MNAHPRKHAAPTHPARVQAGDADALLALRAEPWRRPADSIQGAAESDASQLRPPTAAA